MSDVVHRIRARLGKMAADGDVAYTYALLAEAADEIERERNLSHHRKLGRDAAQAIVDLVQGHACCDRDGDRSEPMKDALRSYDRTSEGQK